MYTGTPAKGTLQEKCIVVIKKDYLNMFYKKILLQFFYLKMSWLIQCVTCCFFVIACEIYSPFLSKNCFYTSCFLVFFSVFQCFQCTSHCHLQQ